MLAECVRLREMLPYICMIVREHLYKLSVLFTLGYCTISDECMSRFNIIEDDPNPNPDPDLLTQFPHYGYLAVSYYHTSLKMSYDHVELRLVNFKRSRAVKGL